MPDKTRPTRVPAPVDAHAPGVVDPTENVIALTDAANKRQDDLRAITRELFDAKAKHLKELVRLHAVHQRQLDRAEAGRINSIRQVDREEVIKSAAAAQQAITTLATSTATVADTLRAQQDVKTIAAENRQSAFVSEISKRISALELSFSEGRGKQTVIDPQLEKLTSLVESLARTQAEARGKETVTDPRILELIAEVHHNSASLAATAGKSAGFSGSWAILLGVVSLIGGLISIGAVVVAIALYVSTRSAATPIYVPAPANTLLPSNPPAATPR